MRVEKEFPEIKDETNFILEEGQKKSIFDYPIQANNFYEKAEAAKLFVKIDFGDYYEVVLIKEK